MKCGRNFLSHAVQLPILNKHICSPTFHESSNISFNISYLGYYQRFCRDKPSYISRIGRTESWDACINRSFNTKILLNIKIGNVQ